MIWRGTRECSTNIPAVRIRGLMSALDGSLARAILREDPGASQRFPARGRGSRVRSYAGGSEGTPAESEQSCDAHAITRGENSGTLGEPSGMCVYLSAWRSPNSLG